MGPAKQLYQIRRITYPAARFFTAALRERHGPSTLRHAGLRARCRPTRVLARRDPKWPRAPPVFGTVGCWVHVGRFLTPGSSKSTVAPSVSACLVGFGTSTAAARAVDVDVSVRRKPTFGPKTARGGAFDDHARIPSVGRLPPWVWGRVFWHFGGSARARWVAPTKKVTNLGRRREIFWHSDSIFANSFRRER